MGATGLHLFWCHLGQIIACWAKHKDCAADPVATDRRNDKDVRSHTAVRFLFGNCYDGVEVVL
jgi:hypothetical protein